MSIKKRSGQTDAISTAVQNVLFAGDVGNSEFLASLRAFGPLPEDGIRELADLLVGSVCVYRTHQLALLPPPAKQGKQFDAISKSAKRLLKSMGIKDLLAVGAQPGLALARLHSTAQAWLPVALYKVALNRRPTTATLAAIDRVTYLVVLLSDLVFAADWSKVQVLEHSVRGKKLGKGGIGRSGPGSKERLLHDLFNTYAKLRGKYPTSGPSPAFGKPLIAFVRAALALAVSLAPRVTVVGPDGTEYRRANEPRGRLDLMKETRTSDAAIRGAFNRWTAQSTA